MSLETVVEDIRDEARQQAEQLREEADEKAAQLIEEAEEDAEEIREEAKSDVETQITREREQTRSSAKLEAKQQRLRARREVRETLKQQLKDELASLSGEQRKELTTALLEAALTEFDAAATRVVYGRAEDESLIKELLAEYENAEYGGTRECLGGVIVEGEQSRVRINNTFDSVLEDVWDKQQQVISNILFEE